jgi:hypothetical protein
MSSPVSYDLQGQGGGQVIEAGDGPVTGDFRWIQTLIDTQFDGLTSSNINGTAKILGNVIPGGVGIGGRFSSIEINLGVVIAYYV